MLIVKGSTLPELEDNLNIMFDRGYQIQGGVTFQDGIYIAVVVKPF